ncbi:MAG: haloacid dehalogenase type II [Actinomycetota bacterium]|nr:haloacid dehalogenase type II [Actinomycetota bacterium]
MTGTPRPRAVAFDVNETLTDLAPVARAFTRLGLGPDSVPWWFAVLLRDGMALAAAGGAARFADLARGALAEVAGVAGHSLPDGAGDEVLDALRRVPVHPDVMPALERLHDAGVPAYALTNGSAPLARDVLDAAGVTPWLTDVLSVDATGHWKPRPEPYHYAADQAGVPPGALALVAVHPWDVHGAYSAGLVTGWVDRGGRPYPAVFARPTVQAADITGVVDGLLDLSAV